MKVGIPLAYASVTGLAFVVIYGQTVNPIDLNFTTTWPRVLLSLLSGPLILGVETVSGVLPKAIRREQIRFRVNLGNTSPDATLLISILSVGIIEELLYRGLWLNVCILRLGVPELLAVILAGVAYAIGHLFFGFVAVIQKLASGIIYGLLAIASGGVLAPILAHFALNICVFSMAKYDGLVTT